MNASAADGSAAPPRSRVLLYVVNDAWFLASHRFEVVAAAVAAGHEVHIAARRDPTVARFEALGCRFHDWALSPRGTRIGGELSALTSLRRIVRRVDPDAMHLITMKALVYGGLLARVSRVPAVAFAVAGLGNFFVAQRPHEHLVRFVASTAYRTVLRHPNAEVIVQNHDDREHFVANRYVDPERITLILGSGVDLTHFRATEEPDEPVKVLLASRLLWRKGIAEYVEVARRLRERFPHARFVLAGTIDVENPQSVRESDVAAWRDEGIIDWRGQCDDMAALLRECHVICLPTYYGEGLPKVLIEACASARAVVCTDWPGCREIVSDGANGLLVPPRDVDALGEALARLIDDASLRRRLGREGRRIAESGFSVESVVARTFEVYERLFSAADRGGSR